MVSSLPAFVSIIAIVLAAGLSTRMGKPKQTLAIDGKPMLQKVLEIFRKTKVDRAVVVLGAGEHEVRSRVRFKGEMVVFNPKYAEGMSGSLKLGLTAAGPWVEAMIVALGDQPYLSPATVDKMIRAYRRSGAPVVVPVYNGRRGNPVLFDRSTFADVMSIRGDEGARSVVEKNRRTLLEVPVSDRGVMTDIDTPADYRKATSTLRGPVNPSVKSGTVSKSSGKRPRLRQAKRAGPATSRTGR